MRVFSKSFIFVVGATLSVAPIFSSALAQQSTQQANMLLEIQELRVEIAELRDMVERQAHQLRQMQRGSQQNNQRSSQNGQSAQDAGGSPSVALSPSEEAYSSESSSTASASYPVDASQVPYSSDSAANGTSFEDNATVVKNTAAQKNTTARSSAPVFPDPDADFYRADESANDEPNSPAKPQVSLNADDGYPPVEERLIGQANNATEQPSGSDSSLILPVSNQAGVPAIQTNPKVAPAPAPRQVAVTSNQPLSTGAINTGTGAAAEVGRGVIAIPTPADVVAAQPQATNGGLRANQAQAANVNQAQAANVNQAQAANVNQAQVANVNQAQVAKVQQSATVTPRSAVPEAKPIVPPVVLSEQDFYQQGFELLKQSKHAQAVDTFKQQIANYPNGSYADDAHYWIAESMYVNRSLDNSKLYFKAIIDNFTQSPRLPDAMLKTAYIEQEQGNQIEARILLQEIIQYHPRSNAAISAKNRLAELD